jgi:hypothetical protein
MTMQFEDITAFEVLLAPEQGQQIHDRVLADLQYIFTQGGVLYSSQYSFSEQDIATAMNTLLRDGGVALFDGSCVASSRADAAAVATATAGIDDTRWAIGCMPDRMIVHDKLYCDPVTGRCFTGSFNLTASAQKEANNALFITSKTLAVFYAAEIERNLPIVKANPYDRPYGLDEDPHPEAGEA